MTTPGSVVAIVQARMGSSRLPGKILKDILGKPMLERQLGRLKFCRRLDKIVLATTESPEDCALSDLAARLKIPIFRGSENDVLDRYYQAAKKYGADIVVRITADCPLIDPSVTDEVVDLFLKGGSANSSGTRNSVIDYASTGSRYPDGLDTEAFSFSALETAWKEARLASEREHVTPFIWKNSQRFKIASLMPPEDFSSMRWTVDYPEDFQFITEVYRRLHQEGEVFLMRDILALLEKEPTLAKLNQGIVRNDGYIKSLAEDHEL